MALATEQIESEGSSVFCSKNDKQHHQFYLKRKIRESRVFVSCFLVFRDKTKRTDYGF